MERFVFVAGEARMLIKTLRVLVQADHETVWKLLLYNFEHPQEHLHGVTNARLSEEDHGLLLREFLLDGAPVKERVTIETDDGKILHEFLEHPTFLGTVITKIVPTARQSPVAPLYLEYHLNLHPKGLKVGGVIKNEDEIVAEIEAEMQQLKSTAEHISRPSTGVYPSSFDTHRGPFDSGKEEPK